ncbi:MAG: ABC transporter permease [Candidatus Acidiferrum sp.]|jgi:predicted permease
MHSILRFFKRIQILIRREEFDLDLEEEMAHHREQKAQALQSTGLSPADAHHAANREFGNHLHLREQTQDVVALWFESSLQDFRFAFRQLRKNPGFAFTAIAMLALGLCASVSIFAFVDATLIKPLPYQDPARIVGVYESTPQCPQCNLSLPDYLDWKQRNKSFASLDAYDHPGFLLSTPEGAEAARGSRVTDGFFRTLGVTPILGRDFYSGEDLLSAPRTVMLSYAYWQKRYGGRSDVLGQTVILDNHPTIIVGVLPAGFHFAPAEPADFWTTLHPQSNCDLRRSCHGLYGVARLKDGVSVAAALDDAKNIAQQLAQLYPTTNVGQSANVVHLSEVIVGNIRPILLMLLSGAGLLLIIAGVNISSLLLVRSESRKREIAIRNALGAARIRLLRQFVTEGLLLVASGTALGLLAAYWTMHVLLTLIPADLLAQMPFLQGLGLTSRVLAFAAALALCAAILFSITPALRLSLPEFREGLVEGTRGSAGTTWRRLGSKLVILELATAVVLLVGAGLLGKSLYLLLHVNLGLQPEHLATLQIAAPKSAYAKSEQIIALEREMVSHVSQIPGVKSVGLSSDLPVNGWGDTSWFRVIGRPWHGEHYEVAERDVSPDYFTAIGAKLVRGRPFVESEDEAKPLVVIINQSMAREYFPGQDPIGQQLTYITHDVKPIEIVGIVEDIQEGQLDSTRHSAMYRPFNQTPDTYFNLAVRTSQTEQSIFPSLDAVIHGINRNVVTSSAVTMSDLIHNSPSAYIHRSSAWLVGGFAAMALLLGVVGLYGVVAYSVSQRTREIGVRIAIGAQRATVYNLILKESATLIAIGLVIGLICSVAASALMKNLLFGVRSSDLPTLFAVAAVLTIATLTASFIPAHRAASVDPVEALRAE